MHTFNYRLESSDKNLVTVYLPSQSSHSLPVIVFCHGWGGNRSLGKAPSALLEKAIASEVALVSFDFYGCGETGGDYSLMTYGRWTRNLEDVVGWVSTQCWADPQRIGAWGISSGSTPALRLAERSSKLSFVISTATCLGVFIGMPNGPTKALIENLEELREGGSARIFKTDFPIGFFLDFIGEAPVYFLDQMKCPVFFLQGALDNVWRRTDAQIGYEVLKRHQLPVRYKLVEKGGHGLDEVPDNAAEEIMRWLAELHITR